MAEKKAEKWYNMPKAAVPLIKRFRDVDDDISRHFLNGWKNDYDKKFQFDESEKSKVRRATQVIAHVIFVGSFSERIIYN